MKVTYKAPPDDSKVVEWGGYTFFDGVAVEVADDAIIAPALRVNQHFSVEAGRTRTPRAKAEKVEAEAPEVEDEDAPELPLDAPEPEPAPSRRRRGEK